MRGSWWEEELVGSLLGTGAITPAALEQLRAQARASGDPLWRCALAMVGWEAGLGPLGDTLRRDPARAAARYEVLGEVGEGGMGRVVRVRDPDAGRDVARKELRARSATPAQRARLLREARITAQLEHPGIVPVYAVSSHDSPTFTMRLVRGRSLGELLKAEPGTPIPALLRLFLRACEAMAYAHDQRVIHRDLTPDTIMVGEHGEVLVLDWGLAKRLGEAEPTDAEVPAPAAEDASLTEAGAVLGTPAYMPPEQAGAQGGAVDARSDVYALGAILYQLLTLRPPFTGATRLELLRRVVTDRPAPPRRAAPTRRIPRALEAIALRALEKEPGARYPSARALADDVIRFLEGGAPSALRAGPAMRALLWARRHVEVAASLVAATALALTLGMVVAASVGRTADDSARLAEEAAAADGRRRADLDARARADAERARLSEEAARAARQRAAALPPYLEVSDLLHRDVPEEVRRRVLIPGLQLALERDPGFVPAHLGLARAWLALADPDAARAHLERALEVDRAARSGEASPRVLHELGQLEARLGRRQAALELAERTVRAAPDDLLGRLARAQLLPDRAAGLAALSALVDEAPYRSEVVVAWVRARAGESTGLAEEADLRAQIARLGEAIEGLSADPITRRSLVRCLIHRASVLTGLGEPAQALRDALDAERAMQGHVLISDQERQEVHVNTAVMLLEAGRDADGLTRLAMADALGPGYEISSSVLRGELWLVRGDPGRAAPELAAALEAARAGGASRRGLIEAAAARHVIAAVEGGALRDALPSSDLVLGAVSASRRPGTFKAHLGLAVEARLCRGLGALAGWLRERGGDAERAGRIEAALRRAAGESGQQGFAHLRAGRDAEAIVCADYALAASDALGLTLPPVQRAELLHLRAVARTGRLLLVDAVADHRAALALLDAQPAPAALRRFAGDNHLRLGAALVKLALRRAGAWARTTEAERDEVLDELEASAALLRWSPQEVEQVRQHPDLAPLRGDPRFEALLSR